MGLRSSQKRMDWDRRASQALNPPLSEWPVWVALAKFHPPTPCSFPPSSPSLHEWSQIPICDQAQDETKADDEAEPLRLLKIQKHVRGSLQYGQIATRTKQQIHRLICFQDDLLQGCC